jgi:ABC-type iron transport system FetAB ATPase subunit
VLKVEKLAIAGLPLLSFEVAAGECLAIEGPSGAGKTRILRALADLDPAGGYVFFEGAERSEVSASEWRRQVRYVSAEPGWWAETPLQHVLHQPERTRFERLAASLGIAHEALDRPIAQLSTGERLRLGLARALADEPRVILLDEPTGALDPAASALVEELIRFQVLARRSVVLVSHDGAQVRRLAHKQLQLGAPRDATPARPAANASQPPPDPRLTGLAERWNKQP